MHFETPCLRTSALQVVYVHLAAKRAVLTIINWWRW